MRTGLTACLLLVVALGTSLPQRASAAADQPEHPAVAEASGEQAIAVTKDPKLELLRTAKISLARAVAIADSLHPGAKTAHIKSDIVLQSLVYRVRIVKRQKVWDVVISAETGAVLHDDDVSALVDPDSEEAGELAALQSVGPGMPDAIAVAERSLGGRPVQAELRAEDGKLKFVVVVLLGDDLKEVVLEPPGARLRKAPTSRDDAPARRKPRSQEPS